jgi:hypothetical protein
VDLGQTNTVQDDTFKSDKLGRSTLSYNAEVTASVKLTHYTSESDYLDGKVDSSALTETKKS